MTHLPAGLFTSVILVSILHAILPNHWLPVVAISRQIGWSSAKTAMVTMVAALSHSFSTVLIGMLVAFGGMKLHAYLPYFNYLAAGILIGLGILFIWRHEHHKHFHMKDVQVNEKSSQTYILGSIFLAMFLSPCLEVGALFLVGGAEGFLVTLSMGLIYTVTSAIGMTLFAWLALQGLKKIDWHKLEHNSGRISGIVLILTGLMFLFLK